MVDELRIKWKWSGAVEIYHAAVNCSALSRSACLREEEDDPNSSGPQTLPRLVPPPLPTLVRLALPM